MRHLKLNFPLPPQSIQNNLSIHSETLLDGELLIDIENGKVFNELSKICILID